MPNCMWLPCHHPRPRATLSSPEAPKKNEEERKLNVSYLGIAWRRKTTTTTINPLQGKQRRKLGEWFTISSSVFSIVGIKIVLQIYLTLLEAGLNTFWWQLVSHS